MAKKYRPCLCTICGSEFMRRKGPRTCSSKCHSEQSRRGVIKGLEKKRLRAAGLLPPKKKKLSRLERIRLNRVIRRSASVGVADVEVFVRPKLKPIYASPWKDSASFYASFEWRSVRYQALVKHGRKCLCCGAAPPTVVIHVDHVLPRSTHPHLELSLSNLQILCGDCNLGKSNHFTDDFRLKD